MAKLDPPNVPERFDPPRGPRFDWRDLSPRNALNRHPSAVTIFAVVLLLIALAIILRHSQLQQRPHLLVYYYDLNTRQIFEDTSGLLVPFDHGKRTYKHSDGTEGAAVRATVYTCGDPDDVRPGMTPEELQEVGAFINTLHRYSYERLEEERRFERGETSGNAGGDDYSRVSGELVADVDALEWYPAESKAGMELLDAYLDHCDPGARPQLCLP